MDMDTNKRGLRERGVTLIEIAIALALIGIIFLVVFNFNDFGVKSFYRTQEQSKNQSDVRIPIEFITKELRVADTVTVLTAVPPSHQKDEFYIDNGHIVYYDNGVLATVPGSSTAGDFTLNVKKINGNMLEVTVGKAGTTAYDVTSQIEVLNIGTTGITGTTGASALGIRFTQNAAMASGGPGLTSVDSPPDATVPQYTVYMLPTTAVSHFSDGTTGYLPIHWNSTVDTSVPGIYIPSGTVLSYTVQQRVTVTAAAITSVADINDTAQVGLPYGMPATVLATMSTTPPSTQAVSVTWDTEIVTSAAGVKTSQGTVVGYTPKVNLTVTVMAKLPDVSAAISGNGSNVKVNVSGGTPGATAVLRDSSGNSLKTATISPAGTCIFDVFKVTYKDVIQTKAGWIDSNPVIPH